LKTIRVIFTFYSGIAFSSLLVTACGAGLVLAFGLGSFLPAVLIKLVSGAFVFFFTNDYKRNQFYYYHNLGLSKSFLWSLSIGFDYALFLFLLITICILK
jgi:hypothetical protein